MSNYSLNRIAKIRRKICDDCGAEVIEYTIALSIFAVLLIAAVYLLRPRAEHRANDTIEVIKGSNPCAGSSSRLSAYPCF